MAAVACAALTSCAVPGKDSTPFWDGKLPFDQRQGIEDYQAQVEPLVGDVITRLEDLGLGEPSLLGPSELQGCGVPGVDGFEVSGASVMGSPVDVDDAVENLDEVLAGAGFTEKTDHRDDALASVHWFDTANGGYFALTVNPLTHTAFSYRSGCRPSDGSTVDRLRDRTTPAWESTLPPFTEDPQSGR